MTASHVSNSTIASLALALGAVMLVGLVLLILMFTLSNGTLGMLNDICNALGGLLSVVLAFSLLAQHQTRNPQLAMLSMIAVVVGAALVIAGSVLVMSGATGFFLAGMYTMTGYALIGLWLVGLNFRAPWPQGLVTLGLVAGGVMVLGFAAIPSIFLRIDSFADAAWHTWLGQAGFLGWAILYPIWCLRVWQVLRGN